MPAPKSPEFRRRAVELARLREKPIAQIAKDLGIAESGLRRWVAQADIVKTAARPAFGRVLTRGPLRPLRSGEAGRLPPKGLSRN
jgi:transposase-like protein